MYFSTSGEVTGNNSLFTMADPEYNSSFVPLFFESIEKLFGNNTALKEKALTVCSATDVTCLFDVALTGDTQAAAESQSSERDYEIEKKDLSK